MDHGCDRLRLRSAVRSSIVVTLDRSPYENRTVPFHHGIIPYNCGVIMLPFHLLHTRPPPHLVVTMFTALFFCGYFFNNTHLYFWLRKSVQIQVRMNRIQGQLSRPFCTKAPKQHEKYKKVPGPCATRTLQRTSSPTDGLPAIAADETCIT